MTKEVRWSTVFLFFGFVLPGCRGDHGIPTPRQIVDLSPAITPQLNNQRLGSRTLGFFGIDGATKFTPVIPSEPSLAYGLTMLQLTSHTGAYLDAPARLLRGGESPAHVSLDRLFGRARVVDLRWHDRHSAIQITDLELSPITEDEIVVLFVGYEPPVGDEWPRYAPLSTQASEWLVAKRIRALTTDMPAIARYDAIEERLRKGQPPEDVWAEYLPLFQAQIPIIAGLVNLDAIVDEPRVAFVGLPLPLTNGNGAPVRAVAFVY